MLVLSNPRHERFAQELAKGKSAAEAYETAGFSPNRHNAATLARKQHILDRQSELLKERDEQDREATERAVEAAALSKKWVLDKLVANVERAMQAKAATNDDGEPVGEYRYEGSVANRALELLGKEMGMFIDRREDVTPRRSLSDIDAAIERKLAKSAAGKQGGPAGTPGGTGTGSGDNETSATVPGHGTA